jgi:hypothetical protein
VFATGGTPTGATSLAPPQYTPDREVVREWCAAHGSRHC